MPVVRCCCMVLLGMSVLESAAGAEAWRLSRGAWALAFDADHQTLCCTHTPSGQRVEGKLLFEADTGKGLETWRVIGPRDGIQDRLAVRDLQGNIQAFLNCYAEGEALCLHPIHRTPHNFWARLSFTGACTLAPDAFACRSRQPAAGRVVQMASGLADSTLNDSLFSPGLDRLVRFSADSVALMTKPDPLPEFSFSCAVYLLKADRPALKIALFDEYYQQRYVPQYRTINRTRCPKAPTGWMSWNSYFDTASAEDNLMEARIAKEQLQPFGLDIWHIESWQDNSDTLPVSGFSNLNLEPNPRQFPQGMAWLAKEIKALGFKPGLWTVPFGTGNADFYQAHKAWFLHRPDGEPMRNWCGKYLLDPSQEAVRNYMRETHRIMAEEWGYDYFKIDGMSGRHESYSAHFYERDEVRARFQRPRLPRPLPTVPRRLA